MAGTQAVGAKSPVPGSARPAEPKGPPPKAKAKERGRSPTKRPKSPKTPEHTPKKEPKKEVEEEKEKPRKEKQVEKASGSRDAPRKEKQVEKASGSRDASRRLTLKVMRQMKSSAEWKEMSYRERVAHQERIRHLLPPGSVGQHLLRKQGSTCSTCHVRRRGSRRAVQAYLQRKKKEYEAQKKPAPAGLARSLLRREGLLKPPGQRTLTSRHETGEKEQRFDEEEFEEVSLEAEPPTSENEEGSEEEEPREEDEVLEGADLEELEPPENSGHSGGSPERGLELPTEELQPDKRPKEPSDKEVARAKQEHAERMRARREQLETFAKQAAEGRKKQLETALPKAKAPPKGAAASSSDATADATSMSSSTAMQNLLHGSLLGGLVEDRNRLLKKLDELKIKSRKEGLNEDEYEEKEQLENELNEVVEKIVKLKERGWAKPAGPKATSRLDQRVHDARYRAAVARGVPHHTAWKEEKARRRAAEQRAAGTKQRAEVNVKTQRDWAEHFMTRSGKKEDNVKVDAVDTVVVDSSGKEVDSSGVEGLVAKPLTRKEKTYYRQEGDEEPKPSREKVEKPRDPEKRRKINEKRAMRRKRIEAQRKGKGNTKGK